MECSRFSAIRRRGRRNFADFEPRCSLDYSQSIRIQIFVIFVSRLPGRHRGVTDHVLYQGEGRETRTDSAFNAIPTSVEFFRGRSFQKNGHQTPQKAVLRGDS